MSILGSITTEDMGGRGKPLPNAKWRVTVESAQVGPDGNGTRLVLQTGQITTPEGALEYTNGSLPYVIGNRKIFVREWTDHQSEQAAVIGRKRIKQLLVATGIVPKPEKGESVSDPFNSYDELAEAVVGRSMLVTTRQTRRKTKSFLCARKIILL